MIHLDATMIMGEVGLLICKRKLKLYDQLAMEEEHVGSCDGGGGGEVEVEVDVTHTWSIGTSQHMYIPNWHSIQFGKVTNWQLAECNPDRLHYRNRVA